MQCLDENTIVAFLSGSLTSERAASAEAHVADCSSCRRALAEVAAVAASAPDASRAHGSDHATHPASRVFDPTIPSASAFENADDDGRADLARRVAYAQATRRVGTVLLDKWRIDALLGIGGMAQVFAGAHRNGRRVAIKVMRPELVLEPSLVQRFLREGYVANKVDHPGAVAVLDDDVLEDGTPFLVMDLLDGRSLGERIHAEGAVPLREALRIIDQVLSVLSAAHARGIVHRDLKPDNLFETNDGSIKVLDFGIARLRERMSQETATKSGITMGTVGYMAPEQARGQAIVDAKSDIWAVGATLYTLLTGKALHEADTVNESLLKAMTEKVPPLATIVPSLPAAVAAAIDRALSFDRDQRYASADEMQHALKDAMHATPVEARVVASTVLSTPDAPAAPTRRYAVGVALLLLVGVGSVLAVGLSRRSTRSLDTPAGSTDIAISESALPLPASAPAAPSASTAPEPSASADAGPPSSIRAHAAPPIRPRVSKPAPASSTASPRGPAAPAAAEERDPLGPRH